MATFNLPELGEGLEEGEIVEWKVKVGDKIQADHTMVEVMTDKATIEVPAPASGTIKTLKYKVGDIAKVGAPLIEIEVSGGNASQVKEEAVQEAPKREATTGSAVTATSTQARAAAAGAATAAVVSTGFSAGNSKVLASPAVRKMAREQGVDLAQVHGSGDRGRVLRTDLEAATTSGGTAIRALSSDERIPFVGIRRKIAESLTKSAFTAVHFTHNDEADFSEIIRLKDQANEYAAKNKINTKVTYLPFIIKAAIPALKKHPILNSYLDTQTNEIVIRKDFHFGISTQTDQGLVVVVIKDCDRKDIFELAAEIKTVVDKARQGKASLQELTGSTITITSVGNIGGLNATPIINYPEVAIIGMYQIKKRPIVKEIDGEEIILPAPMAYMNITCDHRIVDGAIAASFMRQLCDYIENPGRIAFF